MNSSLTRVVTLGIAEWRPRVNPDDTASFARELEAGGVLVLPRLAFDLADDEKRFLHESWSDGRAKNISYDGSALKGAQGDASDLSALARLIARFAADATAMLGAMFPRYAPHLKRARSSFRPRNAASRVGSWRKDDTRLHVDAFPSRPNHGERILRVFCNINPHREDRVWRVGETFETMARRFAPRVRRMYPGEAFTLAALHVTRGRRSEYDHMMLALHDRAKADLAYQQQCPQREVRFAPGTTWICFSDQVTHAATAGRFLLEQTTLLPLPAMYAPARSPLAVLERITGRALTSALGAFFYDTAMFGYCVAI